MPDGRSILANIILPVTSRDTYSSVCCTGMLKRGGAGLTNTQTLIDVAPHNENNKCKRHHVKQGTLQEKVGVDGTAVSIGPNTISTVDLFFSNN
jgi:hypothetical protein